MEYIQRMENPANCPLGENNDFKTFFLLQLFILNASLFIIQYNMYHIIPVSFYIHAISHVLQSNHLERSNFLYPLPNFSKL